MRRGLMQNYVKNNGVACCNFESIADWVITAGSKEENTNEFLTGTQSLKLITDATNAATVTLSGLNLNLLESGLFAFSFYLHSPVATYSQFWVYFGDNSSFTNNYSFKISASTHGTPKIGWNHVVLKRAGTYKGGSPSWSQNFTAIRVKIESVAGQTCIVSIGEIKHSYCGKANILITADDCRKSWFDNAIPLLNERGLKCTMYCASEFINTANYMTTDDLDACYAAGHDIGNHSSTHQLWASNFSSMTAEQIYNSALACKQFLETRGYTRSLNHFCYPNGQWSEIAITELKKLEYLTARATNYFYQAHNHLDLDKYHLCGYNVGVPSTFETVKSRVDFAVATEQTLFLYFHGVLGNPVASTEWSIANFTLLLDYLVALRLTLPTISEWDNRCTNPRLPVS